MKFSAAALVLAATGAMANKNVTYVTEVVSAYTTYCPGPTVISHADKTYTITKATTLTITDCPCTVTKPVITSSIVKCENCAAPTKNGTIPVATPALSKTTVAGTAAITPTKPVSVPTAGAGKAAALSGAGLAGVLGFAAFVL
ncbi:mmc protein [Colletotrichum paranaense]|uniref:Mmc protein n=8 Tax=Colletotrichum acutatum species complex TaxID=2707335 RepID=A0A9P9X9G2_9PEZI|nr:mmc protein [Colletotrichum lupini]XP_060315768.1 mmc protein [Colletotrichum costaricense]XP_060352551.1 mmc protein [Colletotrichum paranaense]XP_060388319.1 mmc protein [Colletotrichum tamarilloi]XP_060404591.1 mmc protein [Colletotrichum abscissum]KAI3532526.1 mmc protein [Colletotrichum filicis]KAK0373809.1 mmc protein [Colletotrichum limetticola]KAK1468945.1 mmc protein [Colletotrichum melonis]KAK1471300.1 mmc protein [Colletotrichum cuscutae]KAI3544009.1 mmc protein [Colletotrich